jgi:hypothetical protein
MLIKDALQNKHVRRRAQKTDHQAMADDALSSPEEPLLLQPPYATNVFATKISFRSQALTLQILQLKLTPSINILSSTNHVQLLSNRCNIQQHVSVRL